MATQPEAPRALRTPLGPWLMLALVLPLAGWVLFESQRVFRADWVSTATRYRVQAWVSGAAAPKSAEEWNAALQALSRALELAPENPDYHERLGDLYMVAGARDFAQPALRSQHYANAQRAYEAATQLRPREPQTWAMVAAARQAAGAPREQVHQAWAQAPKLGPFETHLDLILMQVVLADWDGATPAMQQWATTLFDKGNEAVRRDINTLAARYGLHFDP